jgi:hypothetical protein
MLMLLKTTSMDGFYEHQVGFVKFTMTVVSFKFVPDVSRENDYDQEVQTLVIVTSASSPDRAVTSP